MEPKTIDPHEAAAFVQAIHDLFKAGGFPMGEEADLDVIGSVIDGAFWELTAVSIFLSEDNFSQIPQMMRNIGEATRGAQDLPSEIPEAYIRLADRIEAAKSALAEQEQTNDQI